MRRVVYSVAMSLDGYIAGPKGEIDWLSTDIGLDWGAFMARFDTVLMGRRTFEFAMGAGGGGDSSGLQTYVFSRTLKQAEHPNVMIVAESGGDAVRSLRTKRGKEIWLMGGGELFRTLLEEGVVDVIEVGVVPILLGAGIPFLPSLSRRVKLRDPEVKQYGGGVVMLTYEVRSRRARA